MNVGTTFDCGDVLLIPVPFSDLTSAKQRPVVVITPKSYTEASGGDFIAVGVTSNPLARAHSLGLTNEDLAEGELPKASRVRVDKIFNLNCDQVRKRFGRVKVEYLHGIVEAVTQTLCRHEVPAAKGGVEEGTAAKEA
jgi:mRNA interferase MazF